MKRPLLIFLLVVSGCAADRVADEEPAQRRQAVTASRLDGGAPPGPFTGPVFKGAARQQAMAEVERLKPIQARHEATIMSLPGVFGLGIGHDAATARFVFKVMVDVEAALPPLPAALEGVPLLVVRDTPPRADGISYRQFHVARADGQLGSAQGGGRTVLGMHHGISRPAGRLPVNRCGSPPLTAR